MQWGFKETETDDGDKSKSKGAKQKRSVWGGHRFFEKIETDTGDCQVIKSKSEQKQQNSN